MIRDIVAFLRSAAVGFTAGGVTYLLGAPWWTVTVVGVVAFLAFAEGRIDGLTAKFSTKAPVSKVATDTGGMFNRSDVNRMNDTNVHYIDGGDE